MRKLLALPIAAALALSVAVIAGAAPGSDSLVTVGSPPRPFSQNKQNEPALAIDANHPNVAGRRRERQHRHGGLQRRRPTTPARSRRASGVSGVYFSFDSGHTWTQPTYTGWTARNCLGVVGRLGCRRPPAGRSARCPGTSRTASSPTATRRSRSGRGRTRRRLLLGERLAAVLREPDVELRRHP